MVRKIGGVTGKIQEIYFSDYEDGIPYKDIYG